MEVWKTKVVTNFSECSDPSLEDPKLVFRRSAHLNVVEERKVVLIKQ